MLRTFSLAGLFLLVAGLLPAADVTGTWKGGFDYNGNSVALTFQMKSDGGTVTGTVDGLPTSKAEIKEGKLEGDNLTFSLSIDYQGSPLKILVKGKVAGDEMKLTMGTEGGEWSTDLTAKKS